MTGRILTRRGQPFEKHDTETGTDLFSVSQIRNVLYNPYAGLDLRVLEAARTRGQRLHRRMFFAVAHVTNAAACPYPDRIEAYGGYCDSMDRWIEAVRPKGLRLEEDGWNLERGYAGIVDGLVHLERHRYSELALGDWKTGLVNPTDLIQVVAYSHMEPYTCKHQFVLYLDADGGPAREVWVERGERGAHWAAFLNGLSVLRWRMRYAK
jgi:hypothetical protein